ncbi:glycosyltransferase [Amylibacter sp.]|nr:glycosyltransferase [Amylibacter sp.]
MFPYSSVKKCQLEEINSISDYCYDWDFDRKNLKLNFIKSIKNVVLIMRQINPDIAFSYFLLPTFILVFSSFFSKPRRLLSMIEGLGRAFSTPKEKTFFYWIRRIVTYVCIRFVIYNSEKTLFLNEEDLLYFSNKYNSKSLVIVKGIGCTPIIPASKIYSGDFNIIFVARLLREKGVLEYLDLANKIKKQNNRCKFYVLGDLDTQDQSIIDAIAFSKRNETAIFLGHVNVNQYMASANLMVFPSYYGEGSPRVLHEAMWHRVPVIATNIRGNNHCVLNGVTGYLVEPHDLISLYEKTKMLIEQPKKLKKFEENSWIRAQKYFDETKQNKLIFKALEID